MSELNERQQMKADIIAAKIANKKGPPVTIDGYSKEVVESGDIICSRVNFIDITIEQIVFVVEEFPEKAELSLVIRIINLVDKTEHIEKFPIKERALRVKVNHRILSGTMIGVSVEYNSETHKPKKVWFGAGGYVNGQ